MRVELLLRFVVLNGLAIGAGALVASSCTVDYPIVAFRCNPRQSDNCPEGYFCCSDDPAAPGGSLPDYMGKNIPNSAVPYFSGMNNALSRSGMCVNTDAIPLGVGLAEPAAFNCPIPCNPTWDEEDINLVCGAGQRCCQTVEIQEADCVLDGNSYRPATGHDIPALTVWAPGSHATHQDPNGESCMIVAQGNNSVRDDCIRQLTVANQRGFCMSVPFCPTEAETYLDACERLNAAPPTGGV